MESYIILSFNTLFAIYCLSSSVVKISCNDISDPLPVCDHSLLGLPCPGCQSLCAKSPCDSQPVCNADNGMSVCTAGCNKHCPPGYVKGYFSPSGEISYIYIL